MLDHVVRLLWGTLVEVGPGFRVHGLHIASAIWRLS